MYRKDIIIDELKRTSGIFKDESKLSIDYVPFYLPHREKELRFLARLFHTVIRFPGKISKNVIITGSVGVGKTAVSKLFGNRLQNYASNIGINLRYIHVNCRLARKEYMILKTILKELLPSLPDRGLSTNELYEVMLDVLEKENLFLITALDEVDYTIRLQGPDLIYRLTRLNDTKLNPIERLSLILIVRDVSVHLFLDKSTSSTLQHNIINLKPYSANQLYDILKMRVKDAFFDGVVKGETIKLISDLASSKGDARYAIDLLWRAGKYAELECSEIITPEHVRKAQSDICPNIAYDDIYMLPLQQKLILFAIAKFLRNKKRAYITTGELKREYKLICEEFEIQPVKHTQLWKYVNELTELGYIRSKRSGSGYRGKTTLISLEDVPAETIEKILLSSLREGSL
ncbi:MAG: ORC1-type DNA replication protein [Candidatus Asgardarchaeum sp.]